jgi:hypothetical protein
MEERKRPTQVQKKTSGEVTISLEVKVMVEAKEEDSWEPISNVVLQGYRLSKCKVSIRL